MKDRQGSIKAALNRITLTFKEWVEKGTKLYGKDRKKWKFKCVQCGEIQSMEDFEKLDIKEKEAETYIGFSCIGRFTEDKGCNWTLGGLFQIHKLEIVDPNNENTKHPVFEFADEEEVV